MPHLTYCEEIVVDGLVECRAALKNAAKTANVKLSYMPLIIKVGHVIFVFGSEVNVVIVTGYSLSTARISSH